MIYRPRPPFKVFLNLHPWHMEVPRLGLNLSCSCSACATTTAALHLSRVCNLHHSSWQRLMLNPLVEARNRTCILTNTSRVCYHWAMVGTPTPILYFDLFSLHVIKIFAQPQAFYENLIFNDCNFFFFFYQMPLPSFVYKFPVVI